MDQLDRRILALLCENARMPVKDIAHQVSLTSPAVSSRIRKMERDGIIARYTVVMNPQDKHVINALISVATLPAQRDALTAQVQAQEQENAALAADIAEGATEDKMKEIAQEELGLISPNQRVFSVGN